MLLSHPILADNYTCGWGSRHASLYMLLPSVSRHRTACMHAPSPALRPLLNTGLITLRRACRCVDSLLERVAEGSAEVMVATHNQHSIEHTVARMAELGLEPPGEQVTRRQLLSPICWRFLALKRSAGGTLTWLIALHMAQTWDIHKI